MKTSSFEVALGVRFQWVLHVGDFGVWPDAERIDRATRDHEGAGDFPAWFAEGRAVPRPTAFIKGNHEDFAWIEERKGKEVLPGLTFLPNGHAFDLGERRSSIRVGGLGGCYGPSDYERQARHLEGYARRHYTRDEVERISTRDSVDILLLHDAPAGVELVQRRRDGRERRYVSEAAGLAGAVTALPTVSRWRSGGTKAISERRTYFEKLADLLPVPGARVALDLETTEGMRTVGLKVLKNKLSEYVRLASRGETVLIAERDRAELFAEDCKAPESMWAETLVSSRLLGYEIWTRVNGRGAGDTHGKAAREILARVSFVELVRPVLARALETFPAPGGGAPPGDAPVPFRRGTAGGARDVRRAHAPGGLGPGSGRVRRRAHPAGAGCRPRPSGASTPGPAWGTRGPPPPRRRAPGRCR